MVITLIAHERNLGLLSVTDHMLRTLGRENCAVIGWNYLVTDYSSYLEKIKELSKTKSVIVKYVVPRSRFSGEVIVYPSELEIVSDVTFRVPTYIEETSPTVPLSYYKGEGNPIADRIKELYT